MTETTAGRIRVAQDRMVRGVGQFLDDVKLPGMGYAAFVRSPHARENHPYYDRRRPPDPWRHCGC